MDHIDTHTLTIVTWVYVMLALISTQIITRNHKIYRESVAIADNLISVLEAKTGRERADSTDVDDSDDDEKEKRQRDIIFLGFHKIASNAFFALARKQKHLLGRIHVIDFNKKVLPKIHAKGAAASEGDFSSAAAMRKMKFEDVKIVCCTIPDRLLRGTNNARILETVKSVWSNADVITIGDSPSQVDALYAAGAGYVCRSHALAAEDFLKHLCKLVDGEHRNGEDAALDGKDGTLMTFQDRQKMMQDLKKRMHSLII